ncbi:hypothetical protein Aristophanes_00001 [Acinetobacter phage Aristophanes]|uniref:Uncharacterized protein n=1 Tax=Acinetobacter phage Aristophanes TaxID=2759203 RepID=A0A7G9VYL0_BPACA|nr:hypothetical protein Aristophanes_00001 [Acinetobacter phage Aristophanes]
MNCILVAMHYLAPHDYCEPMRYCDAIVDDNGNVVPINAAWFYVANRWLNEDEI